MLLSTFLSNVSLAFQLTFWLKGFTSMKLCVASIALRFFQMLQVFPLWRMLALILAFAFSQSMATAQNVVIQGNNNVVQQSYVQAPPVIQECTRNLYGRCIGQPYSVGYPNYAVQSQVPRPNPNLSPQEQHAQWFREQRNYERVNQIYRQDYDGLGNPILNSSSGIRPYPSYADYVYRQKVEAFQSAGKPVVSVYDDVATMPAPRPTGYYYITRQQANRYDYLYKLGLTPRKRPENAVVR